jgi:hypothetical protein
MDEMNTNQPDTCQTFDDLLKKSPNDARLHVSTCEQCKDALRAATEKVGVSDGGTR